MSRLTNARYLKTCDSLAKKWHERMDDFSFYSPEDQRYIHDYFRPSEDLTDEQRIAHRVAITNQHPSLPALAGRALKRHSYLPVPLIYVGGKGGKQLHALTVRSVIRPQPDTKKFAQAILALAEQMAKNNIDPKTGKPRSES
jgi:hypothetical protein